MCRKRKEFQWEQTKQGQILRATGDHKISEYKKKIRHNETEHWPSSLVVKEKNQKQVLSGLLGHLLPKFQHIQWGDRNWDTMMKHPLPGHLRVDYLQASSDEGRVRNTGIDIQATLKTAVFLTLAYAAVLSTCASPEQDMKDSLCTWPTPGPELPEKNNHQRSSSILT